MRIARYVGTLGLAAVVATAVAAQGCPTGSVVLTVTPNAANTMLGVSITGTPGAAVVLFQAHNLGQTTLSGGPLAGTVICLAPPFFPTPLGSIPPGGTKTVNLPVPPIPPGASIHFQAVTIAFTTGTPATTDTSNVAGFMQQPPSPPPPCNPGSVQLVITPDVPVQPGNTISISVTGAPGAFVVLASSHALGSTPVPFLTSPLCLAMPILTLPFGFIPTSGTLTRTHTVPPNAMLPPNVTIWFQAVTVVLPTPGNMPVFDTSNTDSLVL